MIKIKQTEVLLAISINILLLGEKLRDAYGKFLQQVINTLFIT